MEEADYFKDHQEAYKLYKGILRQIEGIGAFHIIISKSQIALKTKRAFAIFWIPDNYLKKSNAKLVLSIPSRMKFEQKEWKELYEPYPGRYMHHLEIIESELSQAILSIIRETYEESKS